MITGFCPETVHMGVKGLTVGQPGGAWHHHCSVIPPLPDPPVCYSFVTPTNDKFDYLYVNLHT